MPGLAADRIGSDDLVELRSTCRRGRDAVTPGDVSGVVAANSGLHRLIATPPGIDLLCSYLESLDQRVRWFHKSVVHPRGPDSRDEHDQLLAALKSHDRGEAARVRRWHTEPTRSAHRQLDTGRSAGRDHHTR